MPFLPELRRVVVGLKADFKMEAEARLALAKQRYLRDNGLPCSTEVQIVGVHLRLGDYAHHLVCPIVYFFKKKKLYKNQIVFSESSVRHYLRSGGVFLRGHEVRQEDGRGKNKKITFRNMFVCRKLRGKAGQRVDDHPYC